MSKSLLQLAIERRGARKLLGALMPHEREKLAYAWQVIARPEQLHPDGAWRVWLYLAGRGAGKTRAGAEWVRWLVETEQAAHIALVAETAADARDVMVEEGESSILKVCPPWFRPKYEPSKRRLTWPNGATAITYSAEDPEQLRGPAHDAAWVDELAKWSRAQEVWDNLMLGLRLGENPRCLVTTTPRPVPLIVELARGMRSSDGTFKPRDDVVVVRGSTYDNRPNLAAGFVDEIVRRYEGTRLGRQELHAELLEDVEGALWTLSLVDSSRVLPPAPELKRIVVGVDPAVTAGEHSDETGIVVAGRSEEGEFFVLEDASCKASPGTWAAEAIKCYHRYLADEIVAESNQGGDMVRHTIHSVDPLVPVTLVRASRGKRTRAEPIAALYEQGRVHHVGTFASLEDQMATWVPGEKSPDRMDALVWAISSLLMVSAPVSVRCHVIG